MSIAQQGASKNGAVSAGTASVTFDSIPTNGDLIVLVGSSTGSITTPTGFAADASSSNSGGTRFCALFSRIAAGEASATYSVSALGTNQGVIGFVFRATNGFNASAEVANGFNNAGSVTSLTNDPAGVPSTASSVEVVGLNGSTTNAATTVAMNGGSAGAPNTNLGAGSRAWGHFEIETSAPADVKSTWASLTSGSFATVTASYTEAADGATTNANFLMFMQ